MGIFNRMMLRSAVTATVAWEVVPHIAITYAASADESLVITPA
ncbi:hypothetical protein [Candidatus Synchoanobacter obligatus]|nr:hypothetical protein [Candidatus Synchoanobacter obligatus]